MDDAVSPPRREAVDGEEERRFRLLGEEERGGGGGGDRRRDRIGDLYRRESGTAACSRYLYGCLFISCPLVAHKYRQCHPMPLNFPNYPLHFS